MAITVSCPSCEKTLRIGEEFQGQKVRCPSCKEVFTAPAAAPRPDPEEDRRPPERAEASRFRRDREDLPPPRDEDERPPARRSYDDVPRRRSYRDDLDDEDGGRRGRWRDDFDEDFRRPQQQGTNAARVLGILSCVF